MRPRSLLRFCVAMALLLLFSSKAAHAVTVSPFSDIPTFVKRGKDIVIARCVGLHEDNPPVVRDGLEVWEVETLKTLKGTRDRGRLRVVSLYPMEPSKVYFLYSAGGSAYGATFLALPELSVVEIPNGLNSRELDDKSLPEQVNAIFQARGRELQKELDRLQGNGELIVRELANQGIMSDAARKAIGISPIATSVDDSARHSGPEVEADSGTALTNRPSSATLAGIYRTHFRAVIAGKAPVIVATGRDKPLPIGAYMPYQDAGDTLHVWNWSRSPTSRVYEDIRLLPHEQFALSPDGRTLVWPDGRVLDLQTSRESNIDLGGEFYQAGMYHEHARVAKIPRIKHLDFAQGGDLLIVHLDDLELRPSEHPLRKFDVSPKPIVQLIAFPFGGLVCELPNFLSVAFAHNQESVFIASWESGQPIREHDARSGKLRREFKPQIKGHTHAIAVSPNGQYFAAHDNASGLLVWNLETGQVVSDIRDIPYNVTVLSFAPDSRLLAAGHATGVAIVDVAAGKIAKWIKQSAAKQFRWSDDGETLTVITGTHHFGGMGHLHTHFPAIYEWDWKNSKRTTVIDTNYPR